MNEYLNRLTWVTFPTSLLSRAFTSPQVASKDKFERVTVQLSEGVEEESSFRRGDLKMNSFNFYFVILF